MKNKVEQVQKKEKKNRTSLAYKEPQLRIKNPFIYSRGSYQVESGNKDAGEEENIPRTQPGTLSPT